MRMFDAYNVSRLPMAVTAVICGLMAAPAPAADAFVDPTRPPHFATSAARSPVRNARVGPVVSAIRVSATQKVAVINGKTYRPGDRVAGGRIVDIQPYEVVLRVARRGGGEREVRMRLVPKLNKEPAVSKETDR